MIKVVDKIEARDYLPMNVVTLAPGAELMPSGGDQLRAEYEDAGVTGHLVDVDELIKAVGGLHWMTAFLKRDAV